MRMIYGRRFTNGVFANTAAVQDELKRIAEARASVARAHLGRHRDEGHSSIVVEPDDEFPDQFVMLRDEDGKAHVIEFGTKRSRAVAPLHMAFADVGWRSYSRNMTFGKWVNSTQARRAGRKLRKRQLNGLTRKRRS